MSSLLEGERGRLLLSPLLPAAALLSVGFVSLLCAVHCAVSTPPPLSSLTGAAVALQHYHFRRDKAANTAEIAFVS